MTYKNEVDHILPPPLEWVGKKFTIFCEQINFREVKFSEPEFFFVKIIRVIFFLRLFITVKLKMVHCGLVWTT